MHIVWIKKSALMLSGAKNQIKGVYLTTPRLRNNLKKYPREQQARDQDPEGKQ